MRLVPMTGRDPLEHHRVASPLELLFDLAFVVTFRAAASSLAHGIAGGHTGPAIAAFIFTISAGCWAWINFSWFSSAYDTDDWGHRVAVLLQMIGVVIVSLGIPELFASVERGAPVDASIVVVGYVVMRLAMSFQWLRVARQDPERRSTAVSYAAWTGAIQVGWILVAIASPKATVFFVVAAVLILIEVSAPVRAEHRTDGTPWHPHHLAERYGLLALIALGEGVFGTVAAVSSVVGHHGWTTDAVLVVGAGIGLTFGLWWTYFSMSSGDALASHRERAFGWSAFHVAIFGAVAATGAGLDVAALVLEGEVDLGIVGAVSSIALPVVVFVVFVLSTRSYMSDGVRRHRFALLAAAGAPGVASVILAETGVPLGVCLVVLTLAPAIAVAGQDFAPR